MGFKRGVNWSGLDFNGIALAVSQTTMKYYASKGFTEARLGFRAERLQPAGPGTSFDATYLAKIKGIVDYAGISGISVVLDCHNYGLWLSNLSGTGKPVWALGGMFNGLATGMWGKSDFVSMWTQLVTDFLGNPGFGGIDLMNEPSGHLDPHVYATWPAYAQAVVDSVGVIAPTLPIFVEGYGALTHAWGDYNPHFPLNDLNNQVVYSGHVYGDRDGSGTHFNWAQEAAAGVTYNKMVDALSGATGPHYSFVPWLQKHNVKGHIGELAWSSMDAPPAAGNPNWQQQGLVTMNYLNSLGPIITGVDIWSGGGFWGPGYPFSIDPMLCDAPQMSVILQ